MTFLADCGLPDMTFLADCSQPDDLYGRLQSAYEYDLYGCGLLGMTFMADFGLPMSMTFMAACVCLV